MAKKFVSAKVTYQGGVSFSTGSYKFRKGKPETIIDERLANELKSRPGFAVQILEKEVSEAEAASTFKKKKRVGTKKKRSLKRKPK